MKLVEQFKYGDTIGIKFVAKNSTGTIVFDGSNLIMSHPYEIAQSGNTPIFYTEPYGIFTQGTETPSNVDFEPSKTFDYSTLSGVLEVSYDFSPINFYTQTAQLDIISPVILASYANYAQQLWLYDTGNGAETYSVGIPASGSVGGPFAGFTYGDGSWYKMKAYTTIALEGITTMPPTTVSKYDNNANLTELVSYQSKVLPSNQVNNWSSLLRDVYLNIVPGFDSVTFGYKLKNLLVKVGDTVIIDCKDPSTGIMTGVVESVIINNVEQGNTY